MSQKLPVNDFTWVEDISKFAESILKRYNKESDEWYFVEVDIQYLETVNNLHNGLPFLPERMKIEKIEKLVANLHSKTQYVCYSHKKFKRSWKPWASVKKGTWSKLNLIKNLG